MPNLQKNIRRLSLVFAVLLAPALMGWVDPEFVADNFNSALTTFRSGDFSTAHEQFTNILMDSRGTQYYSMTQFMVGLSSYRKGDWAKAAREFGSYAKDFPGYPVAAMARLYQGNAYYFDNDYIQAVEAYLSAIDIAGDDLPDVAATARKSARNLLWGYLSDDQLTLLSNRIEGKSAQLVDYIRVKRLYARGNGRRALEICDRSLESRPAGPYSDSLEILAKEISDGISSNLTILVLAPTDGSFAEYGIDMANGVRMAVENFAKSTRKKVDVVVENTSADPLVGAYACNAALRANSPIAVIGPLLSDVAVPIGISCDRDRVPLILPTASKDGLAGISPYVFQVSPPPSIGAKALSQYAFDSLGITNFSALAPDDPVGRKAVEVFADNVEAMGGKILSVAYYAEGTIDFSEHLKAIKKPYYDMAKRYFPHADTSDTRFYKPDHSVRPEDEWIIDIPGLFVPAYYDDLLNILPQIPFNYIKARLLGENGWLIDELSSMDGSHLDSAIVVPDDFWVDEGSSSWTTFRKGYRKAYGSDPSRVAALGYDAARLVLEGIRKGAITPEQQRDFLSATRGFRGPSGSITFDETGTNEDVSLVRFNRNRPEKIR